MSPWRILDFEIELVSVIERNLVQTHGFYWANYRIWIMNYFSSKPSTSVKTNVFLDILEKQSCQNWSWPFFNHIGMTIARLPNNFGLFIIGIQSSFRPNTFSAMTCYLMAEKREKNISSNDSIVFEFFHWKCLAKKEEKTYQMTALMRIFQWNNQELKKMTAFYLWFFTETIRCKKKNEDPFFTKMIRC